MNVRQKLINWIISKLKDKPSRTYDSFLDVCRDIIKTNTAPEYIDYLKSIRITKMHELYLETVEVMNTLII